MTGIIEQIILGIIQGVTEWLPVSSDGHLALASILLNFHQPLSLDIFLHVASLLVIVVYFKKDLIALAKGFIRRNNSKDDQRMMLYLLTTTAVTVLVALIIEPYALWLRNHISGIAAGFLISALIVGFSVFGRANKKLTMMSAVVLGIVQGIAVLPGVSRSGMMIGTALLLGLDRVTSFRYTFLAAIPVIIAAFVYSARDLSFQPVYLIGFAVVLVVGYATLGLLQRVVQKGKFHLFSWYTLALAIILFIYAR